MNGRAKKVLGISLKILSWTLVVFSVLIMLFTVLTVVTVDRKDRSIFGMKFYIVQSDSMSKSEKNKDMDVHFSAGDIVFIEEVNDKTRFKQGEIIAFLSTNSASFGETITHKIREVKRAEDGRVLGYVTFGTNTGINDEAIVEPEYVLGKYAGKLPAAGKFFAFVKSTLGYIVCIFLPLLFLIGYNVVNIIRLLKKQKKEQRAVMEREKAELIAEREKNEAALKELQTLKEELAKSKSGEEHWEEKVSNTSS